MADKPILFSGAMVRALLAGTKTQTRRAIEPVGGEFHDGDIVASWQGNAARFRPRYRVGDRLYVRESAWYDREIIPEIGCDRVFFEGGHVRFSDGRSGQAPGHPDVHTAEMFGFNASLKRRPGIHMPRWASRITLTVTDVRVERLQDISPEDAIAEGVEHPGRGNPFIDGDGMAVEVYRTIWEDINGPGAWDANPWVAAYTFTVALGNIDQIGRAA